jgi:hypothetical protein
MLGFHFGINTKKEAFDPIPQLEARLKIATALYEQGRNDEAEKMLLDEYAEARKWEIGKREIAAAEKRHAERIRMIKNAAKFTGEKIKDYELKKCDNEFPDWERNLYCKRIYSKLRIFYERTKQYEKAVPFALAEAYAEYENRIHGFSMYGDPISPDFKAVLRCLKRCKREDAMPSLEKIFMQYAASPDSSMCWRMLDEQFTE